MTDIVLFAGTSEGRRIAEYCAQKGLRTHVCVATDYAQQLLEPSPYLTIRAGRLDRRQMLQLLTELAPSLVIDATHPYAVDASDNIQSACREYGAPCLRVVRECQEEPGYLALPDAQAAAAYLNQTQGNALLTIGSRQLSAFTAVRDFRRRLFVRLLPMAEAMDWARQLGFEERQLICMQGPFSKQMNAALLRHVDARYLVSKECGQAGGFAEKLAAARQVGAQSIVIGRPRQETGISLRQCLKEMDKRFHLARTKRVTLVGVGPGDGAFLTPRARQACQQCQRIFGAPRVLETLSQLERPHSVVTDPRQLAEFVRQTEEENIVVALSGDTGFYSAARQLLPQLGEYRPQVVPGVSCVAYFSSRIGVSWEEAALVSAHGRPGCCLSAVRRHRACFILTGGNAADILRTLRDYGLDDVRVTVGENLSYETERIVSGRPSQLLAETFAPLSLLYIENPSPRRPSPGWPDETFVRGPAPMTKSEVRAVLLSRLQLPPQAVCYDIGAGTGSVALEMAAVAHRGTVYAIECRPEACRLIEENKRRLGIDNVIVVEGEAPQALAALPPPTHVFLGGSHGNLPQLIRAALDKAPHARMALSTVTAESFAQVVAALPELPVSQVQITQLSVAHARPVGQRRLMTAQNPIFLFSFQGGARHEPS